MVQIKSNTADNANNKVNIKKKHTTSELALRDEISKKDEELRDFCMMICY